MLMCVCVCVWLSTTHTHKTTTHTHTPGYLCTCRGTSTWALTKGCFICGRVYRDKLGGNSAPAARAVAWAGATPSARNDGLDR
jgi:hypothetical protein